MNSTPRDLKQLFMQKKPCLIFLAISRVEKPYVSALMKEAETTFAHTTNILSEMEACGLVEFVSEGRVKYVKLTRRGQEAQKALQALDGALGGENLLRDLKKLEKRVNGLETRLKAGGLEGRGARRARKSMEEVAARSKAIETEAKLFTNAKLEYEVKVMAERLEYLRTKLPAAEAPEAQ